MAKTRKTIELFFPCQGKQKNYPLGDSGENGNISGGRTSSKISVWYNLDILKFFSIMMSWAINKIQQSPSLILEKFTKKKFLFFYFVPSAYKIKN